MKNTVVSITALLAVSYSCFGADFVNLDFESGTLVRTDNCCAVEYEAGPALPGWSFSVGDRAGLTVFDISEFVNRGRRPGTYLAGGMNDGNYSVFLATDNFDGTGPYSSLTLSQVGTIPTDANLLTFSGLISLPSEPSVGKFTVSFAGNTLPLVELSTIGAYRVFGADIGLYSGQTGELKFEVATSYSLAVAQLDQIAFSVPEPSVLGIVSCAAVALGGIAARRRLLSR